MIFNLSGNFSNTIQEENAYVDEFIENAHVRLLGCGVCCTELTDLRSFMLPAFLIVRYRTGTAEIRHGGRKVILKPGSLYIFRPYEIYSGRRMDSAAISFSYLQFDITPYIQNYNLMKTVFSLDDEQLVGDRYRRVGIVLEEFLNDSSHKSGKRAMLGQLAKWTAAQIIYDQLGAECSPRLLRANRDGRLIDHAFQYVSEHLSEPVVIGTLVQNEKTSKTSLERAFRNAFNLTPTQALLRYKIERSLEKLQRDQPIKNIAKELGFSSVYHYSNVFKSIMGIRPTEYRLQSESLTVLDDGEHAREL